MLSKTFLPPGFRFHPTDVELVFYYLKRRVMGKPFRFEAISEVDLYKYAPWELPEKSQLRTKDLEWYFFCPRDRKYPNGPRTNRATDIGYWKATGKDRSVIHNSRTVGMIKTLIFHEGKPPKGNRTDWVMHEYRLESKELVDAGYAQDSYVLCKIYQKSGRGPKIGEQYGAPYTEEEWEEDTAAESSLHLPFVSYSCLEPSNNETPLLDPGTEPLITSSAVEVPSDRDLIYTNGIALAELEEFLNSSPPTENGNVQMFDSTNKRMHVSEARTLEPEELFNDLDDIFFLEMTLNNINQAEDIPCEIVLHRELDSGQFVQLSDFFCLGNGDASESIMPNDPFALHAYAQYPNSPNLDYILSPDPYFNALNNPNDAGPDITNAQSSLYMQFGDFGESVPHHNFPVSETQRNFLQEQHPANNTRSHSG